MPVRRGSEVKKSITALRFTGHNSADKQVFILCGNTESYYEMTGRKGEWDGEESEASQDENVLQTIGKVWNHWNGESELVSKVTFVTQLVWQSERRLGKK